jgi:hypothetical protein
MWSQVGPGVGRQFGQLSTSKRDVLPYPVFALDFGLSKDDIVNGSN